MKRLHESLAANIGLRTSGIALIAVGWSVAVRLHHIALATTGRDSHSSLMMLFAAIVFLCGSAGSALLFVGPGLWESVEVSERWRRLPARSFEATEHPGNGHRETRVA